MAETVTTKAQSFASLGDRAVAKITTNLLNRANSKMYELLGGELYAKYSQAPSEDYITAITLGNPTKITIESAHFRRTGSYVGISGIEDDGLWQLNGRHKIEYVEGSGATEFNIAIDSSDYESVAYTSGGSVVDGVWDELQDAEAYILLSYLIPTLIDIAKGDLGVMPEVVQWGEGNVTLSYVDELNKLANMYYNQAMTIVLKNKGDGSTDNDAIIITVI